MGEILANLVNFTKSPNFIRQTSYNSTTIVSILTFSPNFIRQIDIFAKLLYYTVFKNILLLVIATCSTIVFCTLFSLTFQRVVKLVELISSCSHTVATRSSLKLIELLRIHDNEMRWPYCCTGA